MSKYNNKKTPRQINGEEVMFDSKKEAKRFDELYAMAMLKKITELKLQPKYQIMDTLRIEGHKTMPKRYYIPDFSYMQDGRIIVEDVKGMKTAVYNLKKHLFLSIYGDKLIFKEIYNV